MAEQGVEDLTTDQIEVRDGKLFVGDKEITEEEAREAGWEGQWDPETLVTDEEMTPQREAVLRAAESVEAAKDMDPTEKLDAVQWFLEDDPDEAPAQRKLEIDVSTDPDHPKIITWVIQALERETIQEIRNKARKESFGRKARRQGAEGEPDVALANARIVAQGTVYPNLKDPKVRGVFADPADALKHRFRNKAGIIDQLAGHVIEVSGYDDESVKEVLAVGNS
jgi:hypothetical protein